MPHPIDVAATVINGPAVTDLVSKEDTPEALEQDLSLTEASEMTPDNRLIEGRWHGKSSDETVVSVESMAEELGLKINDRGLR